jgi:transposase
VKYEDEIAELREEFKKVDKKDPKALRSWFETNSHLRTSDIALIAERNPGYVRELKKLAGLGKGPVKKIPPPATKKTISIHVPEDWDNEEWLTKAFQLYSVRDIAKATGIAKSTIFDRKTKYGIKARNYKEATKSNNPHCTKAWVYEHYVTQGLKQSECAKLAGIATPTFNRWLVRFKIPVRSTREYFANRKEVKVWCRELFEKLPNPPVVRK